jgi:Fe2+ or Zn2+ uptake regulation protein
MGAVMIVVILLTRIVVRRNAAVIVWQGVEQTDRAAEKQGKEHRTEACYCLGDRDHVRKPAFHLMQTTCNTSRVSAWCQVMRSHPDQTTEKRLGQALKTLRSHRLRVTKPRRAILRLLIAQHGPFTIEEIHRGVSETECDLVTVYRCLATLQTAGLVRQCDFGDGIQRFEFSAGDHAHHHHIICTRCRGVQTLNACIAAELEEMVRQRGYSNVTHSMEFFGICPRCRGRRSDQ